MNNIYITNIYWMLAYAFRTLNEKNKTKISTEKFENIYELFAVIMTQELNKQIKRGLNKEYISKNEELSVLKGKLLVNETINNMSFINNKIYCEFDEYSTNSYLNRIIKTSCEYLIKSNKISDKNKIVNLRKTLIYLKDVKLLSKDEINWSLIKYNRNNLSYKMLINVAYLIIDGLIINQKDGEVEFKDYIDDQKMHRLYEKFILEYYKFHHKELKASVPQVEWNVQTNEFVDLLPKMQTDIVLKYKNKKLIIDAKYYSSIYQNNTLYDKKTFHSNNLYQIYTYVKNEDKNKNGSVSGLLLYAKTNKDDIIDATYIMDGNKIEISNINLNSNFNDIKNKLEKIANDFKLNL